MCYYMFGATTFGSLLHTRYAVAAFLVICIATKTSVPMVVTAFGMLVCALIAIFCVAGSIHWYFWKWKFIDILFFFLIRKKTKYTNVCQKQCTLSPWNIYISSFQQYFSYIVAVRYIGGGNRRRPLICRKWLTNFIK